ncbi:MAG: hypothetical protein K2O24_09405 [Muribaculaceae bacterium]|nr:hypothetical protein [Muribaculaceae bacterium]
MKKSLLLSAAAMAILAANAETKIYTSDELGIIGGVSSNGRYAAIYDDENNLGYIWDAENPEEFKLIDGVESGKVELYAVSDNGIAVGAYSVKGTYYYYPCYVTPDGTVHDLPRVPHTLYTNYATCVNSDASVITGYMHFNDPDPDIPGKYTPAQWFRNEDGEYDVVIYNDLDLPPHQGFITTAASEDGRVIAGRLYCAAGSEIPALVVDGELKYWNKLETRIEPFIYKGQILDYYEEYYIDGFHDGANAEYFSGQFSDMDAWGNVYGYRTHVEDLNEETGEGKLVMTSCIYNYNDDEWWDMPNTGGVQGFSCGLNREYMFTRGNRMVVAGEDVDEVKSLTSEFGFSAPMSITGVIRCSKDGKVLGANTELSNPATGEYQYFPMLIVLDEPLVEDPGSGIEIVKGNDMTLLLSTGRIDIIGGEGYVYDLNGRLAGIGSTIHVAPGAYVVKVGEATRKVMVK